MVLNDNFILTARKAFNPYSCEAGTEHVALLLYSVVRMVRPTTCVEFGSGYSTLFLLAGLADNSADIESERTLLREKTLSFGDLSTFNADLNDPAYREWLERGHLACEVDPTFYLQVRSHNLYSFEGHPSQHSYVKKMRTTVTQLGLEKFFTYLTGTPFRKDLLPLDATPIDLAWNDAKNYMDFFEALWPLLNPEGGLMIFHNTLAVEKFSKALALMQQSRQPFGDLELLSLSERHKLCQNSCTILRRTAEKKHSFLAMRGQEIKDALSRYMVSSVPRVKD